MRTSDPEDSARSLARSLGRLRANLILKRLFIHNQRGGIAPGVRTCRRTTGGVHVMTRAACADVVRCSLPCARRIHVYVRSFALAHARARVLITAERMATTDGVNLHK